jgi:hypothetical protein
MWNRSRSLGLGKLSVKEEPGKLRIFAMVDALTQWLLYPLHTALFSMLQKIPQDGTFNQDRPVRELIERQRKAGTSKVWSFDLSAATDRIPVLLQEILLGYLAFPNLAYMWRRLLCDRWYEVPSEYVKTFGRSAQIDPDWESIDKTYDVGETDPERKARPGTEEFKKGHTIWKGSKVRNWHPPAAVRYAVGQPMGAYSSFAMLAMIHHALVQFAAKRAGYRKWFTEYAVLGDDVVIACPQVAAAYVVLMREIGVGIGFHKSVISNNLSMEFAKRFFFKGEEVTPLPLLGVSVGWLGVGMMPEVISAAERLNGQTTSLFHIARYLGVGFRAASGAANKRLQELPRILRSACVLMSAPGGPRGVADWLQWILTISMDSTKVATAVDRDRLVKHLISNVFIRRYEGLLKMLEQNLEKFVPTDSWFPDGKLRGKTLSELWKEWCVLYLKEPLQQDFEVQRMEIDARLRSVIDGIIMPTDKEVKDLLDLMVTFEREVSAIPKDVVRHKSQMAETSVPLWPAMVKRWESLGAFVSGRKRVGRAVLKTVGQGASPLIRVK